MSPYNVRVRSSIQRVFYHVVGRLFLRRLVLPFFVFLIFVTLADPIIDWTVFRQQVASATVFAQASLFGSLFLGWSLLAGFALRPIWRQPMIAFLVRQPLTRWQWVAGLLPSISVAFLPIFAVWWLAPHHANSAVHYLGFVALSWPIILGASYGAPRSILTVSAGVTTLTILVFAYYYYSFAAYVAILVSVLQLPASVAGVPHQITQVIKQKSGHLSSGSVIVALIRRDLRCIIGTESKSLLSFALFSAIALLMMFALRVNGAIEGQEAFLSGCVLFSLATSTIYESLEKLKEQLGKEIMRHRWPVTYSQRALALIGLISIFVVPVGFLIGVVGSPMAGRYLLLLFLFVAASISLYAALFSSQLREKTSSIGLLLLAVSSHVVVVFLLPGWGYAIVALASILVGLRLISSGLRKFAVDIERTTVDQPA